MLPERLRAALRTALRDRDRVAMAALRSALAAIDNAGAVDPATAADSPPAGPVPGTRPASVAGPVPATSAHVAGAVLGLGAAEVARRELTDADVAGIVRAELDDRLAAAALYERGGRTDVAARLRAEAAVLAAHLG